MTDLTPEVIKAIDTLARWSIYNAVEAWTEEGWESHLPGVGEYDYDLIVEHMMSLLLPDVGYDGFDKALTVMEARAQPEEI